MAKKEEAKTETKTVAKKKVETVEKVEKVEKIEKVAKKPTDKEVKEVAKKELEKKAVEAEGEVKPIYDKEAPRKKASSEKWGILHIYSSYNNTHLHVTDVSGSETIVKVTGGMATKSDRLKASPNVAMAAAKMISEACHQKGVNALYVKLRAVGGHNGPLTPGPGSQAAIRMLTRYGIKLGRIEDVTPIPHDGCRKKGGKRGRRV
jgi:small subunit ribosomal protein S11